MNGIVATQTWRDVSIGDRGIITNHYRYSRYTEVYFPHINNWIDMCSDEFRKCKKKDCKDCKIRFQCWTT